MHRSGTSALCAALHACGASFGTSLLEPMSNVNDEGFWEDLEIVQINQALLGCLGINWYTVTSDLANTDWQAAKFDELRARANSVLQRGFGGGDLEVIKDPRMCITLPFWLSLCAEQEIEARICIISRGPLEVARSLQRRDGFPLGYGLRLTNNYLKCLVANTPNETIYVTYDQLLNSPVKLMQRLAQELPLSVDEEALNSAVREDLNHQGGAREHSLLDQADIGDIDISVLEHEIEEQYPSDDTISGLVEALVARGRKLSEKGVEFEATLNKISQQHINALTTIEQRDAQISALDLRLSEAGEHLSDALAIIPQRDTQILEVQNKLEKLGGEHSYALQIIKERDQQLQEQEEERERFFSIPVVGRLFRKFWSYANS